MNGTQNEIRNQTTNELPLTLPSTPPIKPKTPRMGSSSIPCIGLPDDCLQRPEDTDDDRDTDEDPEDRLDHVDHEQDRERGSSDEDQPGGHLPENRRARTGGFKI